MNVMSTSVFTNAIHDCVTAKDHTQREHAVVISKDGVELFRKNGTSSQVELGDEVAAGKIPPGCTIVHNHPSDASLSPDDIMFATHTKSTIHAVGDDGGDYWSSGLIYDGTDEDGERVRQKAEGYFEQVYMMNTIAAMMVSPDELSDETMDYIQCHLPYLLARQAGVLHYDFKLGHRTAQAIRVYTSALAKAGLPLPEDIKELLNEQLQPDAVH